MPRRSVRTRRRTLGCLSFAISALVVAAVFLVGAIVLTNRINASGGPNAPAPDSVKGNFVDANDLPDSQMVLTADSFSEEFLSSAGTGTPVPESTVTPSPATTLESGVQGSGQANTADPMLLPIYRKADTDEKVIAITLDECSTPQITQKFIQLALNFDAKLTLFPTGENVMKSGMGPLLKDAVFKYGFEIENRGYSELARVYQYIDSLMVQEIWKQTVAVNYVLCVKYQPHFYRMYGGLGETDRRTHAYLKQQGYLGIAHWTISCSDVAPEQIPNKLTPGGIYHFKSTEEDGQRMFILMRSAKDQGYRMVTLNELLGLPANTYTQVSGSLLAETMPAFKYDPTDYYDLFPGDASWAVALMQQRLSELGYLPEESSDGIFGNATADALRMFQATAGMAASGAADVNTQKLLYSDDAPINPNPLQEDNPFTESEENDLAEESDGGLIVEDPLVPSLDGSGEQAEENPFAE